MTIYECVNQWLLEKQNLRTRESYRKGIHAYFEYLKLLNIEPLLIKQDQAERFLVHLTNKYAVNSVRLKISTCSSFYTYLKKKSIISRNPFISLHIPHKKFYKTIYSADTNNTVPILCDDELIIIMNKIEGRRQHPGIRSCDNRIRIGSDRLNLAIHIMTTYGTKAGAISSIEIQNNQISWFINNITVTQPLKNETLKLLIGFHPKKPLENYNSNTMQSAIKKITSVLYETKKIRYPYSANDFRHYFAVNFYQRTRNIVRLKYLLGLTSYQTIEVYLQNLGIK